ncbi:MAG TPA: FAD-dependent oxidoreductase [Patescibacteria group bacterium]
MDFKLIEKREEAKGTKSFFFGPESKIDWLPGQYFYITLPKLNHEDPKGNIRHFTNAASPTEGNVMRITTRVRPESGFKQTLDELQIGTVVEGRGPNGIFTMDENTTGNHIFLAGGIGITAARSIAKFVFDKNIGINLTIVYSNSIPEEITFKDELEGWAKEHNNFKLYMTISKPDESKEKWEGKVGRIDQKLLTELFSKEDMKKSTFWVCGPSAMVTGMEDMLSKMRVPLDSIRTEKFTGY